METTTDQTGDERTLHLSGRMTADRDDERIPDTVRRLVSQGARLLVIDLRHVSYMDSTCLGEIVEASATVKRSGGRLKLVNIPAQVQRLLDISRLTEVLDS